MIIQKNIRGGYSRIKTKALDHDFGDNYITSFFILDLNTDKVELTFTKSKVTADFIVDKSRIILDKHICIYIKRYASNTFR